MLIWDLIGKEVVFANHEHNSCENRNMGARDSPKRL